MASGGIFDRAWRCAKKARQQYRGSIKRQALDIAAHIDLSL